MFQSYLYGIEIDIKLYIVFVNSFISTVYGLKGRKMMARIL